MLTGFPSLLKWTNWRRWALSLSDRFELPQTGQEYDNLEGEGEAELDLPEPALWPPCLSPDPLIYSTDNWTRQVPTLWNNCSENARIMLKFPKKKKFWQGGNPPFNPQKRQKSLRAFFSLGKEIKLKIQGGGKFFKLEERIYTPDSIMEAEIGLWIYRRILAMSFKLLVRWNWSKVNTTIYQNQLHKVPGGGEATSDYINW